MADFPNTVYISSGGTRKVRELRRSSVSSNNTFRSQKRGSTKYDFDGLVFEVDATGRTAILSHYLAHIDASFNFVWTDGQTYVVRYKPGGEPSDSAQQGLWYKVTLSFVGA